MAAVAAERRVVEQFETEEQPIESIGGGEDIRSRKTDGLLAHATIEGWIGEELVEVVGYLVSVACGIDNETVYGIFDLERDATHVVGDGGFAFHEGFGDFEFKTFFVGELEGNGAGAENGVEKLVIVGEANNFDVRG